MVPATPYSGTLIVLYSLIIPGIEIMIAALGTLPQDVRYGLRTFSRNPGFVAIACFSIAIGITRPIPK
jgi:hypothetical protein